MKKLGLMLMILILTMGIMFAIGGKDKEGGAERKHIVVTVKTQQHAYHQAMARQWEILSEEFDFDLTVMDPNMDNSKLQRIVEDIISLDPDGVAFCPIDTNLAGPMLQQIIDAGIPVVAYDSQANDVLCPTVVGDNFQGGVVAGENAGRIWKEKHPTVTPVIGIVNVPGIKEVDDRVAGFKEGFLSVYPNAEVVADVNGQAVREKSLKAASDMLQANPEINIIFGINDDSALGALDALKEIGRDTLDEALVAGIDGSPAAMAAVKTPNNALCVDVGYPSKAFATTTYDILKQVMAGTYKDSGELAIVPLVFIGADDVDEWLATNYPQ